MAQKKVTNIKEADKNKQLDAALGQIERQFGAGTVMRMGDKKLEKDTSHTNRITWTRLSVWEIGGLPRGRVVEIYGPESSGKRQF
ncbi:MAG: hypothetical protein CM1200mP12_17230 [Gammaproteobacteria bacterium]|nr:MAG: hypothetical protein CM1200mP12_17230 [Gammaproteobacteria bacterium]